MYIMKCKFYMSFLMYLPVFQEGRVTRKRKLSNQKTGMPKDSGIAQLYVFTFTLFNFYELNLDSHNFIMDTNWISFIHLHYSTL